MNDEDRSHPHLPTLPFEVWLETPDAGIERIPKAYSGNGEDPIEKWRPRYNT